MRKKTKILSQIDQFMNIYSNNYIKKQQTINIIKKS